jgi:hypothetical protein
MTRIPRTLNIGPEERAALEDLSKMEGRPVNELLNEAVKHYLGWRRGEMRNSEATLSALRAYRKQDPGFRKAIDEFVEAEAGFEDPLEDGLMQEQLGPVQRKIRDILDSQRRS